MSCEYVKREILVKKDWDTPEDAIYKATHLWTQSRELMIEWRVPEPYTFPSFLPDGWWIAMDEDGDWYCYEKQPDFDGCIWFAIDGRSSQLEDWLVWTPPAVKDAASSLMQVKHVTSEKEPSKR